MFTVKIIVQSGELDNQEQPVAPANQPGAHWAPRSP
jgi:hypothetical protein